MAFWGAACYNEPPEQGVVFFQGRSSSGWISSGMSKNVWVSRQFGKYHVGMWLPIKRLLGLGFLVYLGFAFAGLISVSNKIDNDKEFYAQKPVVMVNKWTCTEDRERMPEGLKRMGMEQCWSTERNARGDYRYEAVGATSIVKARIKD